MVGRVVAAFPRQSQAHMAPARLSRRATLREAVSVSLAGGVMVLAGEEPGVRLGDIEAVHRARVGTRRLRSDLQTLRPVLSRDWVDRTRQELRWLATALGEVRDADVLLVELRKQASQLAEIDRAAAGELIAELSLVRRAAHDRLQTVLDSDRYQALLAELNGTALSPPFDLTAGEPDAPARRVLRRLVRKPWRRLRSRVRGIGRHATDETLHTVRKRAKSVRYAAEMATPLLGKPARRLAGEMETLHEVLGQLHDAVVAEAWLRR
ncbi:MAG: CHAD domain-containing protein, partial [Candidatus Dormiibacterota bacterium]